MRDFYHPTRHERGPDAVPHILGLTASPIVRSKPSELQLVSKAPFRLFFLTHFRTIEANLDSISRTPRVQRQEMLEYVHRPVLCRIDYRRLSATNDLCDDCTLQGLISVCERPGVQHDLPNLNFGPERESYVKPEKMLSNSRRSSEQQLRKFLAKAEHVYEELGPWAVDYFILESIARLERAVKVEKGMFFEQEDKERAYLHKRLSQIPLARVRTNLTTNNDPKISPKLDQLISFLVKEDNAEFSGLIFVRQRATVIAMTELLSIHPETKDRFQCASYVGLSNSGSRKQTIGELLDIRAQRETLTDFRNGNKNLIIATDVLEEGIDITACRLVVCYDSPPNLKSFVQRRGRARQKKSKFAIMVANDDMSPTFHNWQKLEEEMIRAYQDDSRRLKELSDLENISEDVPDRFRVSSTGYVAAEHYDIELIGEHRALLSAEMAVAHLYHFCALLPPQQYVDLRPAFTFMSDIDTGLITGAVVLPNCLSPLVRYTTGRSSWRTEHAAMKDAAFQAYMALYREGLVNDNLLPLNRQRMIENDERDELPSILEISEQFNPWINLAKAWSYPDLHQTVVSLRQHEGSEESELSIVLKTPAVIPLARPFPLHWDSDTTYIVHLGPLQQTGAISSHHLQLLREITHTLLRSTHSDPKPEDRMDFVALFAPEMETDQFETWLLGNRGRRLALEEFQLKPETRSRGLVRSPLVFGVPHVFGRWRPSATVGTEIEVECSPLPRRRNFLHRGTLADASAGIADKQNNSSSQGVRAFPAESCTVDLLPLEHARFSLFIPTILRYLEVHMVAGELCQTVLKDVGFRDFDHVVTAISASSAHWVVNYQRYEFLGDSLLKFIVSSQLFVDHQNWHEGYLSECRNGFVSNLRLAKAALDFGLDAFILTKSFAGRKWTYPRVSGSMTRCGDKRSISSKVLADVVEALIGAAFIDRGFSSARACIHTFLRDIHTHAPNFGLLAAGERLRRANSENILADTKVEVLIGHEFRDKGLLVEALTHPSCERDTVTESYQRLEFLGDAVLDIIVVSLLFEHNSKWSHGDMTAMKAALVNADLLAFLCMETSLWQETIDIQQESNGKFGKVHGKRQIELWKFMRHHSQEVMKAQQACLERYQQLRRDLKHCLERGKSYPWVVLAALNANKFYSDLVESVLGAIFVDSKGSLAECQHFAERIGILPYLRRIVGGSIDVTHPKTALGRLTGSDKIEYIVECVENVRSEFRCLIRVKENDIVAVGGCLTKDEAILKAAHAAVELISRTTPEE